MENNHWHKVDDGQVLDWFEQDHEHGQEFVEWLKGMLLVGFIKLVDGQYYIAG